MPDRPGVDNNPAISDLVALWRAGQADIDARLAAVHADILVELRTAADANRIVRLNAQANRLAELADVAAHQVDDLARQTRAVLGSELPAVYRAGASVTSAAVGGSFTFTQPHRAALEVLAADTYADVLTATRFVEDDAKRFVRDMGRRLTGFTLTGGDTARQQARALERELAREFGRRGIGAVQYADGSRHGFGEYADMLLRTKTGVAYNAGTTNQARQIGIVVVEILDGSLCGLTAHADNQLANGLLVPIEIAEAYPLAHPNCRRAFAPRPDLTLADIGGDFPSVQSSGARSDQRAFEQALRAQQQQAARSRQTRQRRSRRPRRQSQRATRLEARKAQAQAGNARRRARVERLRAENQALQVARQQAARADSARGRAARRARIEQARADHRAMMADRGRVTGRQPDAELLDRYGINADQYRNARAVVKQVKADIREAARREAEVINTFLDERELSQLTRPARLRQKRDLITGQTRYVRDQSGYEFIEGLDDAAKARVRARMTTATADYTPDVHVGRINALTGQDFTEGEAMDWLTDLWLREDGLRSIASGRIPKYADADALLPGDYEFPYKVTEIFGRSTDEAAAHIAQRQAEIAAEFAERALGRPVRGPGPWEMDAGTYLRELEDLTEIVVNTADGFTREAARSRLLELAPPDIDDGRLNPIDLLERIRIVAQQAGYEVPSP